MPTLTELAETMPRDPVEAVVFVAVLPLAACAWVGMTAATVAMAPTIAAQADLFDALEAAGVPTPRAAPVDEAA